MDFRGCEYELHVFMARRGRVRQCRCAGRPAIEGNQRIVMEPVKSRWATSRAVLTEILQRERYKGCRLPGGLALCQFLCPSETRTVRASCTDRRRTITDESRNHGKLNGKIQRKTHPDHEGDQRIGLAGARRIVAEGGKVLVTGMTESRLESARATLGRAHWCSGTMQLNQPPKRLPTLSLPPARWTASGSMQPTRASVLPRKLTPQNSIA